MKAVKTPSNLLLEYLRVNFARSGPKSDQFGPVELSTPKFYPARDTRKPARVTIAQVPKSTLYLNA